MVLLAPGDLSDCPSCTVLCSHTVMQFKLLEVELQGAKYALPSEQAHMVLNFCSLVASWCSCCCAACWAECNIIGKLQFPPDRVVSRRGLGFKSD